MNKIDKFHRHEALDRTHVLSAIFDTAIAQHPFIQRHPDLQELSDKIEELLGDLYQAIGAKEERQEPA